MSQARPGITVLTSVYNAERFVKESIESILNQTFTDFELVVIDDGSTDGSSAIVDALAEQDGRVVLIRQENVGLTRSLNRGLGRARGELVARHDADDISLPERLQVQWDYMKSHPGCAVVGSRYEKIDDAGKVIKIARPSSSDFPIRKRLLDKNAIPHPGAMFRRALVESVGGYDETLSAAQDYDLWCRLSAHGSLHNIPRVLFRRRVHEAQVGISRKREQEDCRNRIRDQYRRRVAEGSVRGPVEWYLRFLARKRTERGV